jgi:hypothetical protein
MLGTEQWRGVSDQDGQKTIESACRRQNRLGVVNIDDVFLLDGILAQNYRTRCSASGWHARFKIAMFELTHLRTILIPLKGSLPFLSDAKVL